MALKRCFKIALSALAFIQPLIAYPLDDQFSSPIVERIDKEPEVISPKAMIISMFTPEAVVWSEPFDLSQNVTIPGLSPLFPSIKCNPSYEVCQVITAMGISNAASTLTALSFSDKFDLSKTYWLIAGIAGIAPSQGTLASATFARFTIQADLFHIIDARQMPSNWSTGWFGLGALAPNEYPINIYGTEVFEVNEKLRDRVFELAKDVTLEDSEIAKEHRQKFDFAPANEPPTLIKCDTAASNPYWYGSILEETIANYTKLITNGTATYCSTQQEDNATLESLMRAAKVGKVDFGRIAIIRTASNFDRNVQDDDSSVNALTDSSNVQGGFEPACQNLFIAGSPFINDVLENWDEVYANGETYAAENYIGDILGSLGGKPDFGPYASVEPEVY